MPNFSIVTDTTVHDNGGFGVAQNVKGVIMLCDVMSRSQADYDCVWNGNAAGPACQFLPTRRLQKSVPTIFDLPIHRPKLAFHFSKHQLHVRYKRDVRIHKHLAGCMIYFFNSL